MASLYGVNGDGAVYYDDGGGLIWIPDIAAFNALGFQWSDISWGDTLPYPAQNPYRDSDNPQGLNAPPPEENPVGGNPPPAPTEPAPPPSPPPSVPPPVVPPPSGSGSSPAQPAPVVAVVGPANIVAGYSITPDGQVVASSEAPPGSIPGPITLAAGYTIYNVNGQATVGPVGGLPTEPPPDSGDVPLDPVIYGVRQPSGNNGGVGLAPTYNGKLSAQGAWTLLVSALGNEAANGIGTAQIIAKTMGNAVV